MIATSNQPFHRYYLKSPQIVTILLQTKANIQIIVLNEFIKYYILIRFLFYYIIILFRFFNSTVTVCRMCGKVEISKYYIICI